MVRTKKTLLLCAVATLLASVAQAATWTTIDFQGARRTFANGINNGGDIVGGYVLEDGIVHAFIFSHNNFTTIDPPGSIAAHAMGINDTGQIAGWYQTSDQRTHGFLLDSGVYTTLDGPAAKDTVAEGVNNLREVVGFYTNAGTKGFRWNNGNFLTVDAPGAVDTQVRALDNLRHIVGTYDDAKGKTHSFIQNGEGFARKLPLKGSVYGINDRKILVGGGTANHADFGFKYNLHTRKMVKLLYPGTNDTTCFGINNDGEIVGVYGGENGKIHGFLRRP
jgi:probable HAF family extracellular repeat protein